MTVTAIKPPASRVRLKADTTALTALCIDFLEVPAIDQHLARLAAGAGRHESFSLHHVHEPCGAAESKPHLALQICNGRLAGADDDACRLVVELVLLELDAARPGFLFLRGDRVV